MWKKIFSPDNAFFRVTGIIFDMIALSAVTILISLPVVTVFPALSSLYYVTVRCFRGDNKLVYKSYFSAFKQNFLVGAAASAICAFGCAPFVWLYLYLQNLALGGSRAGAAAYIAVYILMVLPAGFMCWIYPLLGRFEHSLGSLLKTAAQLTVKHILTSVVLGLMTAETVILCLEYPIAMAIAPSALVFVTSLFTERIFARYMPETESEPDNRENNGD